MKELSIEEKAKAYDEAIEKAKSKIKDDKDHVLYEDDVREDFVNEVYRVLDADSTNDRAIQIIDAFDNLPTVAIEKQGEQKPQRKSALEAAKEEKIDNANKAESKFKVGDWLQYRNAKPFFVEEITNQGYVNGDSCLPFNWENEIHLWTIQDAKDGDVVVDKSDGTIGIFLSIGSHPDGGCYNNPSYCFLHCHCDDEFFYADFEHGNEIDSDDLVPATKEQCDTLEKVMADAGYTFDFEKKELKKIYQKPADNIESSAFKDKLLELFQKFRYIKEGVPTNGDIIDYVDAHIQELIDTVQNKPWSEEDETYIEHIINAVKNCYTDDKGKENPFREPLLYWLKSLKDRYTWKPSDEQIKVCKEVFADILSAKGFDLGTVNSELNRLEEKLKKLREE